MVGVIAPHVLNIPRFLDSAIDSIPKTLYVRTKDDYPDPTVPLWAAVLRRHRAPLVLLISSNKSVSNQNPLLLEAVPYTGDPPPLKFKYLAKKIFCGIFRATAYSQRNNL